MVAVGQIELFGQPWKLLFIVKIMWEDFTIQFPKIVALFGFALELRGDVLQPLAVFLTRKISTTCWRKDTYLTYLNKSDKDWKAK